MRRRACLQFTLEGVSNTTKCLVTRAAQIGQLAVAFDDVAGYFLLR